MYFGAFQRAQDFFRDVLRGLASLYENGAAGLAASPAEARGLLSLPAPQQASGGPA